MVRNLSVLPRTNLNQLEKKIMNESKLWKASLKHAGLESASNLNERDIDSVAYSSSILSREMIELREALNEHLEFGDQHSGMKLRNVLTNTLLKNNHPIKGDTMEEYASYLLQQVEE